VSVKAFEKLQETERAKIIQACMAEFAGRGFKNASTNAIVNVLGIPKGSIFYWFSSKDNLYLYLVDLSVNQFVKEFSDLAQDWPGEILARLRIIIEASFAFLEKNPDHYRLFMSFMDGEARHLLGPYLKEHWNEGLAVWSSWYAGVDTSDFRSTPEEVQQLLMWVIAGIKVEMYALMDRRDPTGSTRPFFMEKLNIVIRLLAQAIYRHPEQWGYA
jgi:TetR/AcrR family transcriptional regulator